ncbi:MAG: hypothetical protein IJU89_00290 [Alphaproteobacteria bacterium]|nr:hypothetical protein [Alphaproteobacteria bacterium]
MIWTIIADYSWVDLTPPTNFSLRLRAITRRGLNNTSKIGRVKSAGNNDG